MNTDHVRRQEINRLAQHPRLRLDAAHAPADDAQPVDHRRVGIRADQRIGIIKRRLCRRCKTPLARYSKLT